MPNVDPDPSIERFQGDVLKLLGSEDAARSRFCVAVSGGPDSMALLFLACRAFPGQVVAATVDHGLRAEARVEAEMVANWCREQGVTHAILSPETAITGSIQASARKVRYQLLHQWRVEQGAGWLLTAHHADDQCETVLMRLNRSSGVGGLAAIRSRNNNMLRPLLGWRRSDLADVVENHGLPHVLDPSNEDVRFDRVAMRKNLKHADWLDPIAFAHSASACGDADDALEWMVQKLADQYLLCVDGKIYLHCHDFPKEIQRRLLFVMLKKAGFDGASPRREGVEQILVQLNQGKSATMGDWLFIGGKHWCLGLAPARLN